MPRIILSTGLLLACCLPALASEDIVLADFEGRDYGNWRVTGTAFGSGPARGTLPNQMAVSGYLGNGLVNSYLKGDDSEGSLTSPGFVIQRKRINFLIGGGKHPGKACINLLLDGRIVRTATGQNSEHLRWHSWDVAALAGKQATIEIADRQKGQWGHINVDQIVRSDEPPRVVDNRDELLAAAEASTMVAAGRVRQDLSRPSYHILPPGNWNNDPNGPLYAGGYYHLFYQYNPYGDGWGHMHWGHVRSRDLAHWEHQPIALWPSKNLGEDHVFSGCAAIDGNGRILLFYTSIGGRLPEQWAAVPEDSGLVRWKKHSANPILTEALHGAVKIHEWRDPFIFEHAGRVYMVLGGNLNNNKGGQAVVCVYRAENKELTDWRYLGVLFQHPDPGVRNIECPNFFSLDGRWVLIVSQGQPVQYFVGDLDTATMKFKPRHQGVMDHGHYYAPNCMKNPKGRRVLWGWVNGFPAGKGWNGCLTLPRILSLDAEGTLLQSPAKELELLREQRYAGRELAIPTDACEIKARMALGKSRNCGIRITRGKDRSNDLVIQFTDKVLEVAGLRIPFEPPSRDSSMAIHAFLDRSVLEVFVANRMCATRVVKAVPGPVHVLPIEDADSKVHELEGWSLHSAWSVGTR